MTEDLETTTEVETEETTEEVSLTVAVAQIAGFVAATAGVVFITRKVMDRFDRKKVETPELKIIDTTSTEIR